MDRIRKLQMRGKQLTAAVLCVMMVFLAFPQLQALASGDTATNTDVVNTSLYTLSSAAAGYLSDELSQDRTPGVDSGIAGAFLGYCDEADTSNTILDWFASALSSSSVTYSYDALAQMDDYANNNENEGSDSTGSPYSTYGNYGRLLNALGYDNTGTESGNFFRSIQGGMVSIFYFLTSVSSGIFSIIVDFLQFLNPFQLFRREGGGSLIEGANEAGTGFAGTSLATYVTELYNYIVNDFAWAIIVPFLVIGLIVSLLLTRKDKVFEIKKFVFRIAFIGFLVPVLGSLYTTALEWMDGQLDVGNAPATTIVLSTFLDFGGWASGGSLGLDEVSTNINLQYLSGISSPAPSTVVDIRNNALAINLAYAGTSPSSNLDTSAINGSNGSWNTDVTADNGDITMQNVRSVTDILNRFTSGAFYYPGDLESEWKQEVTFGEVQQMIEDTDSVLDWKNGNGMGHVTSSDRLWGKTIDNEDATLSSTVSIFRPDRTTGLSVMSLYNYLSSKFTDTGVIVYSNEKASSGFVRESHYSVNMVGTGIAQLMIFINTVVMLGVFVIMAVCYGFGMLIANVKRTVHVIASLPFGVMGSLRFGAKAIAHTLMMIVEVVFSLFLYTIAINLLFSINTLFEDLVSQILQSAGATMVITASAGTPAAVGAFSGYSLLIVSLLLSTIFYVWVTIVLVRFRKTAVKGVDEMIAGFVNRIIPGARDSDMIQPEKPGLGSRLAAAGGAAAGTAIAGRMAQSSSSEESQSGSANTQAEATQNTSSQSTNNTNSAQAGDNAEISQNSNAQIDVNQMDPGGGSSGSSGFDESDRSESAAGENVAEQASLADDSTGSPMEEKTAEEMAAETDGDIPEGSGVEGAQGEEPDDGPAGEYDEAESEAPQEAPAESAEGEAGTDGTKKTAVGDSAKAGNEQSAKEHAKNVAKGAGVAAAGAAAAAATGGASAAATAAAAKTAGAAGAKKAAKEETAKAVGEQAQRKLAKGDSAKPGAMANAAKASSEYATSEAQRKALEQAAGMSGEDAVALSGGEAANANPQTQAAVDAADYGKAASEQGQMAEPDYGRAQTPTERSEDSDAAVAAAVNAVSDAEGQPDAKEEADMKMQARSQQASVSEGMQAAREQKGSALTANEKIAARKGANAILNDRDHVVQRAAGYAGRKENNGVPLSDSQKKGIAAQTAGMIRNADACATPVHAAGDAAVDAARRQAVSMGKNLTGSQEASIRKAAETRASHAVSAGSAQSTTHAAALLGASYGNGGAPLSADDEQRAHQAADAVLAQSARETSTHGMAETIGMTAAAGMAGRDADGRPIPLSPSQVQAVRQAANTAVNNVQNAALASAETTKGSPLTAQEAQNVRESVKNEAVSEAAVASMEAVSGRKMNEKAKKAVSKKAAAQMDRIQRDNSQASLADKAVRSAAEAVRRSNNRRPLGRKASNEMRSQAATMTAQAAMGASPQALSGEAALNAANTVSANYGGSALNDTAKADVIRRGQEVGNRTMTQNSAETLSRQAGAQAAASVAQNRAERNKQQLAPSARQEAVARGTRSGGMSQAASEGAASYANVTDGSREAAAVPQTAPERKSGLSNQDIRRAALLAGAGAFLSTGEGTVSRGVGSAMTAGSQMYMANQLLRGQTEEQYAALARRLNAASGENRAQIEALKTQLLKSGYSKSDIDRMMQDASPLSEEKHTETMAEETPEKERKSEKSERRRKRSRFEIIREAEQKKRQSRQEHSNTGHKDLHRPDEEQPVHMDEI